LLLLFISSFNLSKERQVKFFIDFIHHNPKKRLAHHNTNQNKGEKKEKNSSHTIDGKVSNAKMRVNTNVSMKLATTINLTAFNRVSFLCLLVKYWGTKTARLIMVVTVAIKKKKKVKNM
jgi:hypothetical protein